MGTYTTKWFGFWQITFATSLLWLAGCSLGLRTDPGPPPTAVASPTPTIIATFTAVAPLAAQDTPTNTPEPTATNTRRPTVTATIPPPTATLQPTSIPTLTADQLEEELLPALIFREVDNEFRYPMQRVTWEYGLRHADYCQYGPYRWLTNDHLRLYPLVGQTAWFEITTIGEVTWPVVANLDGRPAWGVASLPTDVCDLPVWSAARQQLIEAVDAITLRDEIMLRDLSGAVVETYAGDGPLHLAPSGQRLLAGNQWLDLEAGTSITTTANWARLRFSRPAWSSDERQLFSCCFAYTDATTGDGWLRPEFPGFLTTGIGVGPGFTGSQSYWVAEDTAVLIEPVAIRFSDEDSRLPVIPVFNPTEQTYIDLIADLGISASVSGCAPSVSPVGSHALVRCRELTEELIDQPYPVSYLVTLPSLTTIPITGTITFQGWSANGRFLTYTEYDDEAQENGRVWLLDTDGERRQLTDEPANRVWWHPSKPLLALRLDDPQRLRLVQAETGQERSLEMFEPVEDLAWQPGGEGLALQTADNRIWWLSRPFQPRPYRLLTMPIPLAAPNQGETLHSLRWSPDGTKLAYVHDKHLSVIMVDSGPQTVYSEALDFAIDLPPRWVFYEVDGFPMFTSDERFGDWPTPMYYFVYVQEYPNPAERPFAELVTADFSDEIQANFSYTTGTIGPYTVHRTERMPSMSGALTVFFELPGRYLALALAPYDSEQPYQDQERYLNLFEAMLRSVTPDR
jgi:hypothetical protein